jgi:hypothetical protein
MASYMLTEEQRDQLQRFAAQEGRRWKAALRGYWERGEAPVLDGRSSAVLYGLRNTHGPSWLHRCSVDLGPDLGPESGKGDGVMDLRTLHQKQRHPGPYRGKRCPLCKDPVETARPVRVHVVDREADRIDGYDRDDLGESPDY